MRSNRFPALFRWFSVAACLAVALGYCSQAFAAPGDNKALREALQKNLHTYLMDRGKTEHISALSMHVSFRDSDEEYTDAVGTTTFDGNEPVTPTNLFHIGSNTKTFTAVILLRLEAEGVLRLDDTLGKWLPQYPAWSKVTIRELLQMTSGIPTYDSTRAWERDYSENPYRQSTLADLVAYVYPKIGTPGEKWEYSNTGYILAEMVIVNASSSHSYKAEVDRLIAETCLHNTFYESYFYPAAVNHRLVSGYFVNTDDDGLIKLLNTDTKNYSLGWAQGAGGMISDPKDLSRWIRALFEGDVLPHAQKIELESLVSTRTGKKIKKTSPTDPAGFGLGVFQITAPPLGLFWFYQGSTIGYRAAYSYLPDSGVIITVFTNSQTSMEHNHLNDVLIPELYETLKHFGKI